jgi:hypothetical protein
MFERAIADSSHHFDADSTNTFGFNEDSEEDDESTSDDDDDDGRPMSVHDIRRQAAEGIKRPDTATSVVPAVYTPKSVPRHTVT